MRVSSPHSIGDLVHIKVGTKRQFLGILLQLPTPESPFFKAVTSDGHVFGNFKVHNITFTSPAWHKTKFPSAQAHDSHISAAKPAGLTEKVGAVMNERGLTSSILQHLSSFQDAAEKLYRIASGRIVQVHSDCIKEKMSKITLSEITGRVFQQKPPSPAELYTIKKLTSNGLYFVEQKEKGEFAVRPLARVRFLVDMISRKPLSGSKLKSFLEKCEKLIKSFRNGVLLEIPFDESDQQFINQLKDYLETPDLESAEKKAVSQGIVGNLGNNLYNARYVGRETVMQLLKEIGVFTRNQDISFYRQLPEGRPQHLPFLSKEGDDIYQECIKHSNAIIGQGVHKYSSFSPTESQSTISRPLSSFHSKDPLASIRVEIDDPVFVIDSDKAHELDDGISLEEGPQKTWIHVHIANPTAYIPPTHPLARFAQLRGMSAYLPHLHFPMMPPDLSKHILNLGTSLGALCFSASLDEKGDICDYKISPTLVKNPRFVSYNKADCMLKWDAIAGIANMQANPLWIQEHLSQSLSRIKQLDGATILSEEEMKSLLSLQALVARHKRYRLSQGALLYGGLDYSVSVREADVPIAPHTPSASFQHRAFAHTTTIEVNPFAASSRSPSQVMVEEAMIIAGRVAAKYCTERSIPVSFRGQCTPIEGSLEKYGGHQDDISLVAQSVLDEAVSLVDPISGILTDEIVYQKLLPYQSAAFGSTTPVSHFSMGIPDGYVKTTSPLRRYQDMHSHYQIQSSLLGESRLPFSLDETMAIVQRQDLIHRQTRAFQNQSKRYWTLEFIRRQALLQRDEKSFVAPDPGLGKDAFLAFDRKKRSSGGDGGLIYTAVVMKVMEDARFGPDVFCSLPYLGGFKTFITSRPGSKCQVGDRISVVVDYVCADRGYIRLLQI